MPPRAFGRLSFHPVRSNRRFGPNDDHAASGVQFLLDYLIEALAKAPRDLWNRAKVRDFNIGVQAGMDPHSYEIELEEGTVKAASEIHARIVFTVYAPETERKRT